MDKTLHAGTISIAFFLTIVSLLFAGSALTWLISDSILMGLARVILIGALAYSLINKRQFTPKERQLVIGISLASALVGLSIIFNGGINVLDAVLFLQASVSFGLVALVREVKPAEVKVRLTDVDSDFNFQPVFGSLSSLQRQFRPEIVSSGLMAMRSLNNSSRVPLYSAMRKNQFKYVKEVPSDPKQAYA